MASRGVGPDGNGAIVVRSGAMGACVGKRNSQPKADVEGEAVAEIDWVPAYWAQEKGEVRDVTGGQSKSSASVVCGLLGSVLIRKVHDVPGRK